MLFLAFLGLLLQLFICLIISRFVIRMHTMVFVNREAADIRALNAHAHLSAVVCEHTDKKWPTLPKKQKENKLLNYRRFSIGSTSVHLWNHSTIVAIYLLKMLALWFPGWPGRQGDFLSILWKMYKPSIFKTHVGPIIICKQIKFCHYELCTTFW